MLLMMKISPLACGIALALAVAHAQTPSDGGEGGGEVSAAATAVLEASRRGDFAGALEAAVDGAAAGDAASTYLLGQLHEQGKGIPKADPARAVELYQRAADLGLPEAVAAYARCLEAGIGVPEPDFDKAFFYWEQAAEAGSATAQARLGFAEWQGQGRPPSAEAARPWLENAAEAGDLDGMFYFSHFLEHGLGGVERDVGAAIQLCARAADSGQIDAMNQMGMFYLAGTGLPQDRVAASGWFRLAADSGSAHGMMNLAECYAQGGGVVANPAQAVVLTSRAARLGLGRAQHAFGTILEEGAAGLAKSEVFALAYYLRAAASGYSAAPADAERLRASLAPPEVAQAEALSTNPTFHLEPGELAPAAE
ncbi:hypothetical protein BH23VER1_BH23VER1_21710 [soil metagenome]